MTQDYVELAPAYGQAPAFMGRLLRGRKEDGYASLARELGEGECLFFVHDQLIKKIAVPVIDQEGLDRTYGDYAKGLSIKYQIAAGRSPSVVVLIIQLEDDGPIEIKSGWL